MEPPKPSTRLSKLGETLTTVADRLCTEPERLGKLVRGELDWIVMKAMEKDRRRRYATADALADDLRRFLAGDPSSSHARKGLPRPEVRAPQPARGDLCVAGPARAGIGPEPGDVGLRNRQPRTRRKELARRGEADHAARPTSSTPCRRARARESRRLAYSPSIAAAQSALRAGEVAEASASRRCSPGAQVGVEVSLVSLKPVPGDSAPCRPRSNSSSNRKWLAVYRKDDPTIRIVDIETLDDVSSTLVGTGDRWAMPSDAADRLSVYRREAGILEMWNVNAVAPSWHRAAGLRSGTFIGSQLVAIDGDSSSGPEILADAETGRDVRPFPAGWQIGPGSTKFLGPAGSYDALADSVTGEGYTALESRFASFSHRPKPPLFPFL